MGQAETFHVFSDTIQPGLLRASPFSVYHHVAYFCTGQKVTMLFDREGHGSSRK